MFEEYAIGKVSGGWVVGGRVKAVWRGRGSVRLHLPGRVPASECREGLGLR